MATHSSILAWRIPWTEEPGELKSMGPQSSHMYLLIKYRFAKSFFSLLPVVVIVHCKPMKAFALYLVYCEFSMPTNANRQIRKAGSHCF